MKQLLLISLFAATAATPAWAQTQAVDHAAHHAASAASASADMTVGEVRKVDKDTKKITIKHGEIKNLEMPPMTMVFQVKDPAWLDTYKAGDAIRFSVEKTATGVLLVTDIQPGK
jgi:Cu/Ag efflux protein CusF